MSDGANNEKPVKAGTRNFLRFAGISAVVAVVDKLFEKL
jgi:hypothetical protein